MTVGADIKEVLSEAGGAVTILRSPTNITGEYIRIKLNKQVTKPFIREFFTEAIWAYDTAMIAGDEVQFIDNHVYLVMNKTAAVLEGEIYQYNSVLHKTNVVGRILRKPSASSRDTRYRQVSAWTVAATSCYALMTESLYGNEMDTDEELANLGLMREDLYISFKHGIRRNDRFDISSIGALTKTSVAGTIVTGAAIAIGNAPITETWTITFDDATHFHVTGSDVGLLDAAGVVGTLLTVEDYFTIPASFFSGTWVAGNTCVFDTTAEYYWVQDVKTRRYNDVWVATLEADNR